MQDPAIIRLDIEYLGRRLDVEVDETRKHELEQLLSTRYEKLTKALTEKWKSVLPEMESGRDRARRADSADQ
ncbi:MAG TPA: hypothetical protein VHT04_12440 [Stellaceae bacterium]|jgi:hypothetical protein|nr:hypothetical protein [Stellaceae bacterium]